MIINAREKFLKKAERNQSARISQICEDHGASSNETDQFVRAFTLALASPERREELIAEEKALRLRQMEEAMYSSEGTHYLQLKGPMGLFHFAEAAIALSRKMGKPLCLRIPFHDTDTPSVLFSYTIDGSSAVKPQTICDEYHIEEYEAFLRYADTLKGRTVLMEKGLTKDDLISLRPASTKRKPGV